MSTLRERFKDNDAVIFDVRLSDEELMDDIGTLLEMVDQAEDYLSMIIDPYPVSWDDIGAFFRKMKKVVG